jgi:hypothetical protein
MSRQVDQIEAALKMSESDDVTPHVIAGASRIQELVTDLLAGAQPAIATRDKQIASAGWGPPCTETGPQGGIDPAAVEDISNASVVRACEGV